MNKLPEKDERTEAVENTSYRWGYTFITYALLLDVAYQAYWHNRPSWDLMGIVIAGSAIASLYQAREEILGRTWLKQIVLVASISAAVAAIVVLAGR